MTPDFSRLTLSPDELRCQWCGIPVDQDRATKCSEGDLCEDCYDRYMKSENADGGPFRVTLWEFISERSGLRFAKEYFYDDLYEAMDFGMCWKAKVYNAFGIEIMDYSKLPF